MVTYGYPDTLTRARACISVYVSPNDTDQGRHHVSLIVATYVYRNINVRHVISVCYTLVFFVFAANFSSPLSVCSCVSCFNLFLE